MLFGPRLFRSRWTAVLWAAGMLWFAVDVAGIGGGRRPPADGATTNDATGVSVDDSDTRNALSAFDKIN